MEKYKKYIFGLIGIIIISLFVINFSYIIAWILIAVVVAMIGGPIAIFIEKLHYKNFYTPKWIAALISLITLWMIIIVFLRITIPLISNQISELQNINVESISEGLAQPIYNLDNFIRNTPIISQPDFSTEDFIVEKITSIINFSDVGNFISDISSFLWNLLLSVFAVSFISFFFLKDRSLFDKGVLAITPTKYEDKTKSALVSIRNLISRYLIGIILQSISMMMLYIIGLLIIGVNFNLAVLIGIIAGLFNIIPYIGPWIGAAFAVVLITVSNIHLDFYSVTSPILLKLFFVVASAQMIDNIVFQPLIFSNTVRAHPIEIFLIILIAGSLSGVLGMMLAIPAYTVFRVIAYEFFNQYKFVQSITQGISKEEQKIKSKNNDANI